MLTDFFENTFRQVQMPVIVCSCGERYPLILVNPYAQMLLNPQLTTLGLKESNSAPKYLGEILRFSSSEKLEDLVHPILSLGSIKDYRVSILTFEHKEIPVTVTANHVAASGEEYIVLYFIMDEQAGFLSGQSDNETMNKVFHASQHTTNTNEAIHKILRIVGSYVRADRAYIFEEISPDITRNTFEWCNQGIEPAIDGLQNLKKDDYNYDAIVRSGVYIANDIRDLPIEDRKILEPQGIKSLAIITLYHKDSPLGYIGLDICSHYHVWSSPEIEILRAVSDVTASLLVRKNMEEKAALSLEILQTISDNLDSVIYVNRLDDYRVVFTNKAASISMGIDADQIIGAYCWKVFQRGQDGPCAFCPIPKMIDQDGNIIQDYYTWEFQNTITKRWYLIRDAIIKWVDGVNVHIETAVEITPQKQYEQQLEYFASTDVMTGIYNREWGYKIMQELLNTPIYAREATSLCFLDIDSLKYVNDTFGHDAGDDMIITIINTIRSCIRKSDIMFRWGGDEFILLLQCNRETSDRVVRNAQSKLEGIYLAGDRPYALQFSYGIVDFHSNKYPVLDSIITEADRLMYQNKSAKALQKDVPPPLVAGRLPD